MSSVHSYTQRVYYSDTDAGGIVYHSRYLDIAEHARTEFVRETSSRREAGDELLRARKIGFVVKKVEIVYHSPAFLDDLLTVHSTIVSAKRFSITIRQRVMRGESELATLTVRAASIDLETYSIVPLEPWFVEEMNEYLEA